MASSRLRRRRRTIASRFSSTLRNRCFCPANGLRRGVTTTTQSWSRRRRVVRSETWLGKTHKTILPTCRLPEFRVVTFSQVRSRAPRRKSLTTTYTRFTHLTDVPDRLKRYRLYGHQQWKRVIREWEAEFEERNGTAPDAGDKQAIRSYYECYGSLGQLISGGRTSNHHEHP